MLAISVTQQPIMPDSAGKNHPLLRNRSYLPDLCSAEVFLRTLLAIELIAIVFALVSYSRGSFYVHIALISVFMLWVGLCVIAALCGLNRHLGLSSTLRTTLYSLFITLLITLLLTFLSWFIEGHLQLQGHSLIYVLVRNGAVAFILMGLALRYFYLEFESKRILEVQAKARLQALQARIRPHFLFNSMNTIASLTHEQPDLAEQSIENLADLFRASLAAESSVSLEQELELTRSYIALEALRLGERLKINWSIPVPSPQLSLPALTLQPLVENAIRHGIEPIYGGGSIDIHICQFKNRFKITIDNALPEGPADTDQKGNRMALENIRERLYIAFGGTASMQAAKINGRFIVTLELPMQVVGGDR